MYSRWRPSWEFSKAGLKWNIGTGSPLVPISHSRLQWLWLGVTAAPADLRVLSPFLVLLNQREESRTPCWPKPFTKTERGFRNKPKAILRGTVCFDSDGCCIPGLKLLNNIALDRTRISITHSRRPTPEATRWFILFLYNYTLPRVGCTWWFTEMWEYLVIIPHSWSIIILSTFAESFAGEGHLENKCIF